MGSPTDEERRLFELPTVAIFFETLLYGVFLLTARFIGDGKVLAFSPSQLKPLNHLQRR